MSADVFSPPRLLRNPHLQSVLASSRLRRFVLRQRSRLEHAAELHDLHCPGGAHLQGYLTRQNAQPETRGLVMLLHGWEGCAGSNYVLDTGGELLQRGFDVFRLNFRDHGDTHHLNPELFSSNRIEEVVEAVALVQQRFDPSRFAIAGFSLGGNFALRVALRAPAAGIRLDHAAAVCPVISPAAGMAAIERAPWFYQHYFMLKWVGSLKRKQKLFPEHFHFSAAELKSGMRELTRILVERHTTLGDLDSYLDSYSIAGERLASLQVPTSILTSADDPIIPVVDFHRLQLPPQASLEVLAHGGHCGFFDGFGARSHASRWVAQRLQQGLADAAG
jgi:predicted alpha/beta-fold hydrolase